jgi:hypothetical protein
MVRAWHGRGMTSVNQTRPHCVNQMGKTISKPLAARHGRGTAWARHAMCESALTATRNPIPLKYIVSGSSWCPHSLSASSQILRLLILYYDQQMHNYFTNYDTPTCFAINASSTGNSYSVPCQLTQVFQTQLLVIQLKIKIFHIGFMQVLTIVENDTLLSKHAAV